MTDTSKVPFWKSKQLSELSRSEWESLCDGCARCCLRKIEDIETGRRYLTHVACRLLNIETCRCRDYGHRQEQVSDCRILTPQNVPEFRWLPRSCAYRRLAEGKDLPSWHPLVRGDPASTRKAGMSVRDIAIPAPAAGPLEDHVIAALDA
jgi:uncharacterized protein